MWTSFNQPARISDGPTVVHFAYGADEQRIKKQGPSGTTHYVGGGRYEKITRSGREIHRYYVRAGGQVIARVERRRVSGTWSAEQTRYLHRDHLGSVDTITNEQGQVAERLSFDAFGQRRMASWQDGFVTTDFTQGFTGHEHDDEVGLIHMRGRLYDPVLGRFLSADPFVQTQDNPQALNRYSYVNNNPLSYTDPSGFFLKKLFKKVKKFVKKYWKPIVAIAAASVTFGWASTAYFWANAAAGTFSSVTSLSIASGIVGGTASGFVAGAILTGSLKGAAVGAVSGAAFGGISGYYGKTWTLGRAGASSLAGGASAELAGGSFRNGFLTTGFTSFAGPGINRAFPTSRVVAAAVVGGTASEIGGGKFANGAVTFGFLRLFKEIPDYYQRKVGYDLDIERGGEAVGKGETQMPVRGANNIGTQHAEVDPTCASCEGGAVSRFANQIPGINAVAGMHDVFQVSMGTTIWRDVLNVPGMAVAAGITYPGFIGQALNNAPANLYVPVNVGRDRDRGDDRFIWVPAGAF